MPRDAHADAPATAPACSPLDLRADAEEILLLAQDEGCQTIVVGHHLSNDDGEKLANALIRSPGHTIWAVDSSL